MGHRDLSFDIQAPPDRVHALLVDPGSRATLRFGGPWTVRARVLAAEPGLPHRSRAKEMLGLVTCTTTMRFRPVGTGTRLEVACDYVVAGGPIGRRFDGRVGDEMTEHATKEYSRLKWIAGAAA